CFFLFCRALYTYEDDSNDLILSASGDGGLAEIAVNFDNSRIMYGFCSLKEATAALPRYILINWVGEDVPDARKCACASHVATIAEFFQVGLPKGVDVIVNASSMDDIEPSAIGQRLTNGTAPVASPVLSRLRVRDEENLENVGSTYQKTNAENEMKKINREEFWEQAKREEELRKEEERKKAAEERQRFENERMELERKEQEEREKRYREREQQIEEQRKKMQEEDEAKDKSRNQPLITEPSCDDQGLEKKESEVEVGRNAAFHCKQPHFGDFRMRGDSDPKQTEMWSRHCNSEAAAIIAQRPSNPREFFKQRERAIANSVDISPVMTHRTGRLDSPFLRQQHSPSDCSPPPSRTPPQKRRQPGPPDLVESHQCYCPRVPFLSSMLFLVDEHGGPAYTPSVDLLCLPSQLTDSLSSCVSNLAALTFNSPKQTPVQESGFCKTSPTASPQPSSVSPLPNTNESLLDMWDTSPAPAIAPSKPHTHIMDLMEDTPEPHFAGSSPAQPLLSFDEVLDAPFCTGAEDDPSSLVDIAGSHQMTLSYQQALQHASNPNSQDLEDTQLLLTNGDTLLKEGTQASEGYFSQSQEEDFVQSDDCTAKVNPTPVFYNKPPEIDITCWDTDPVMEDDDD
ncbi:hypothetical protein DNTS_006503, partial [Danionella cerebrum]